MSGSDIPISIAALRESIYAVLGDDCSVAETDRIVEEFFTRTKSADEPSVELPKIPIGSAGFPKRYFYPTFLRRVANALDALVKFEASDPAEYENPHYAAHVDIPLYDVEMCADAGDDPNLLTGLEGWLHQLDEKCWVFVPYVKELQDD